MPRLEPIPIDELKAEARRIIEDGTKSGLYATPVPLQIFAYRTKQLEEVHAARLARGEDTLLGGRILELIRIRSAQLGECQPCMQSRKHESITDDDVACLLAPGHSELTPQERLAVEFIDLLSADHHAMDDAFYRRLGEVFSAAQIVELGFTAAAAMGLHRFIHTLDVFGTSPPAIAYTRDQVDSRHPTAHAKRLAVKLLVILGLVLVAAPARAGQEWELISVTRGAAWEVNQATGALKQNGKSLEGVLKDKTDGKADYRIRVELDGGHAKGHFWFVSENDEGTTLTGTYSKAPKPIKTHCPEQIQLTNSFQYIGLARDACEP